MRIEKGGFESDFRAEERKRIINILEKMKTRYTKAKKRFEEECKRLTNSTAPDSVIDAKLAFLNKQISDFWIGAEMLEYIIAKIKAMK